MDKELSFITHYCYNLNQLGCYNYEPLSSLPSIIIELDSYHIVVNYVSHRVFGLVSRYGFQGQEKDNEVKVKGTILLLLEELRK